MVLFGICIRRDRRGISLAIRIRRWEKVIYLKKYPEPEFVKAPEQIDPTVLTEVPTGKVYGPEDMDSGEPFKPPLIEPEDM